MEGSSSINSLAHNILLIPLLFISAVTLVSAMEKTSTEFIRKSCSTTIYPTLCFNSLSARASEIQTSPKLLAQIALSVTLDATLSTSSSMVKLSHMHDMTPREVSAMKDCVELLSDSAYELKNSLEEMKRPGSKEHRLVMSDIQTWVSAALTDEDTCCEGFANDPKMKNVVRGKIVNVAHLTSNALALVNNYASIKWPMMASSARQRHFRFTQGLEFDPPRWQTLGFFPPKTCNGPWSTSRCLGYVQCFTIIR